MMKEGKLYWQQRFREVGIAPDRIMNEIWRAHYVDQMLFNNPVNRAYGVDETVIYQAMCRLQSQFGEYDGDAESYIRVYGTAMAAPAYRFAPHVQWARAGAIHAWWRHWGEGKTALIWHADRVLAELKQAEEIFGVGRVYALADDESAGYWQAVYPSIRWVRRAELGERRFGYVHVVGDDRSASEDWLDACGYVADGGVVTGMVTWETFGEIERRANTVYLAERVAGAHPRVWMVYGREEGVGVASYRKGIWHIDCQSEAARRYLLPKSGLCIGDLAESVPIQKIPDASVVWVTDAQVANEYVARTTCTGAHRGRMLQAGDIVVAAHGESYRVALVPNEYPPAATVLPVLRPHSATDGWKLFAALLQETTRHRLAELSRAEKTPLQDCVWELLPLADSLPTDAQCRRLESVLQTLAQTRALWQSAVNES